jgi:hypothetical protein
LQAPTQRYPDSSDEVTGVERTPSASTDNHYERRLIAVRQGYIGAMNHVLTLDIHESHKLVKSVLQIERSCDAARAIADNKACAQGFDDLCTRHLFRTLFSHMSYMEESRFDPATSWDLLAIKKTKPGLQKLVALVFESL